jgi:hypothetical protein
VENLKIFSLFYLAHLLRTLNDRLKILKQIDRQSDFEELQAFEKISKMYGRLVIFTEAICRLLKYHTTAIIIYLLILTSAKVKKLFFSSNLINNFNHFRSFGCTPA